MYDERIDRRSGYSTDYSGDYPSDSNEYHEAGTGRHRAPNPFFSAPLVPPDSAWDPAEELAFMLQDAMEEAQRPHIPMVREEPSAAASDPGSTLENLQEITAELPPIREVSRGHRKVRERRPLSGIRTASHLIAALAAVIASTVSFFGGMVAYDPLRIVAVARMENGVASWWPLLVYGPWLVASLSVLRAALHQRRAVHSWCVVLLFSSIAMLLCVVQAPKTIVDASAAALPGLASLACFQQVVRQITLTRPPRRTSPRHRLGRVAPPDALTDDTAPSSPPSSVRRPASSAPSPSSSSRFSSRPSFSSSHSSTRPSSSR
ncbi:DUF2637 domain-containing protein [Streptomyces sp. NPDC020801]|uniref:DUF2637 domain-containing protein n=1 Tax=unclassified Streptomyces TaxID=2593676 RepID=UPI0037A9AB85